VHLDQHGQAELARLVVQPAQLVVVERGHDQQREVGAGGAGLEQLVGSTMKSLRSSGVSTAARTARRSSRLPPKRRCSVSTLIAAARRRRTPASAAGRDVGEVALAGAAALDLRDDARAGGAEARHRVARRVDVGERRPQVGSRRCGLASARSIAHAGDDVVEHGHGSSIAVGHGLGHWAGAQGQASHPGGEGW
jgi:hypothetical protein